MQIRIRSPAAIPDGNVTTWLVFAVLVADVAVVWMAGDATPASYATDTET
jgi:hypothetical protein